MDIGFVVYDGLEGRSGGYRYDRKLSAYLEARGDSVEVVDLPWRSTVGTVADAFSRSVRAELDRPVDVLLQDELCHQVLWRHNRRLTQPDALVALVHLLRTTDPTTRRPRLARQVERRYLRSVDGAVCASATTEAATTDLAGLPATVAYPAGRQERAAVEPRAVETEIRADPMRITFVGNLVPRKGALTLLSALSGLEGEWEATVVGGHDAAPGHAGTVQRRVEDHEFAGRVDVTGAVTDDELDRHLAQADVLAVPSRRESFGMVYLEAMERGTVPVATAAGGPPEFVVDGYNGRLVRPGDPAALRDALQRLLEDRAEQVSLARGALETAEAHPTWEESMERVRQFLRAMVEPDVSHPPEVESPVGALAGNTGAGHSRAGGPSGPRFPGDPAQ